MQWGLDMEAAAKKAYTKMTGRELIDGGFVEHRTIEYFGATPDAFISFDGLLEVKCPRAETHTGYLIAGVVPPDYKPQMLAQLACTGRKWVDFMSYDPRSTDERLQSFIIRFEPSKDEIEKIEIEAKKFLAEVELMWDRLTRK
jgi:exodeoxyribonuclease (lambda-induced)